MGNPPTASDFAELRDEFRELKTDYAKLKDTLDKLDRLAERFEGMSIMTKTILWAAGPIFLGIMWVKDHVKW